MKHFLYAILVGLIFTIFCALGCAAGMEFKDYQYEKNWDWLDFLATVLGGLAGQILQLLIVWLIWKG